MMPWTRLLRGWQQRALLLTRQEGPDCLIMATPAAGKTTFALRVAHDQLDRGVVERVVIVCPTDHLRTQWTQAAAAVGLQLDPDLHGGRCVEARDYIGAVVTYHQVALKPAAFAVAPSRRRTLVVLDEIHHAADGREWGTGLREAFGQATYRLALSGTPFRSDDSPIPFVRYHQGVSRADFAYGYTQAIRDGVCRPMYFPSYEGDMAWRHQGRDRRATFFEHLDPVSSKQRLKTALLSEAWVGQVVRDAHARLLELRAAGHAHAGGLVVAMNQAHARAVAALLGAVSGVVVPVAISDDPSSSATIKRFTETSAPWLVAVNMVSEGVDIPRLRIGVYATNVSTEMYFRQVVGRFVRMRPELGAPQPAWLYLPKDPTLVDYARAIEAERNHAIAIDADSEEEPVAPAVQREEGMGRGGSSFVPVSASARQDELFAVRSLEGGVAVAEEVDTLADQKARLREQHSRLVSECARATGTGHREINLELIKRVGGKIDTATVSQLERRIRLLASWRDRGCV